VIPAPGVIYMPGGIPMLVPTAPPKKTMPSAPAQPLPPRFVGPPIPDIFVKGTLRKPSDFAREIVQKKQEQIRFKKAAQDELKELRQQMEQNKLNTKRLQEFEKSVRDEARRQGRSFESLWASKKWDAPSIMSLKEQRAAYDRMADLQATASAAQRQANVYEGVRQKLMDALVRGTTEVVVAANNLSFEDVSYAANRAVQGYTTYASGKMPGGWVRQ